MEERFLGKITKVKLGFCGKDKEEFGFTILYQSSNIEWGVYWGLPTKCQDSSMAEIRMYDYYTIRNYRAIQKLICDAKVKEFNDLVGLPVEIIEKQDGTRVLRILAEVL